MDLEHLREEGTDMHAALTAAGVPATRHTMSGDYPDALSSRVEWLVEERDDLRLTLAAERGDPAGALLGWNWSRNANGWERGERGEYTVQREEHRAPRPWVFRFAGEKKGAYATAREAMAAADAEVKRG